MINTESPFSVHIKNQLFPGFAKGQKETFVTCSNKALQHESIMVDHQYALVRLNPDTFEFDRNGQVR